MYKKVRKTLLIVFTTVLLSVITAFSLAVVFAYYSNLPRVYTDDNTSEIARIGMRINLLFDRLDPDDFTNGTTITYAEGRTGEFDNTKPWGSKDNPYIISLPRHMLNLYALQTSGYFNDRYIKNNYDNNDNYIENSEEVPYFLVCGTDGTPIAIDGKRNGSNIEIKPIGNEQYPFIGVIGGAQVDGTTKLSENDKSSNSSIIANFTVLAKDDEPDIGLFGKISYLGDEADAVDGSFNGSISIINDLLLYDIQIKSQSVTVLEQIADHLWSWKNDTENTKYHEDHHIGILAGHIEYAGITNISIYYSGTNNAATVNAINVTTPTGSTANYMSDSGIIGYVYNLNPEVSGTAIGSGTGTTIAGAAEGAGNEWGASIDMKSLHQRLQKVLTEAKKTANTYPTAEVVVIDKEGNRTVKPVANSNSNYPTTFQDPNGLTITYYTYYSDNGGSFVFADRTGTYTEENIRYNLSTRYDLFMGKSSVFFGNKTVTTYIYGEDQAGYIIYNGSNYLNATESGIANGNSLDSATVWQLDGGKLNARVETATGVTVYYLNANGTVLSLVTNENTATNTWNCDNNVMYLNGGNWKIAYDGAWFVCPSSATSAITIGDNYNYLSVNNTTLTNSTNINSAARWFRDDNNRIYTYIGTQIYYLRATTTALSLSTNGSQSGYIYNFTYNSTSNTLSFTSGSTTYYVVYNNGWRIQSSISGTKIYVTSGTTSYYLNANTTDNSVYTGTNENSATMWNVAATGNNRTISTTVGNTTYYLRAALETNNKRNSTNLTVTQTSGNATTFTYNGTTLTCSLANATYSLALDNETLKMVNTAKTYYTIRYNTNYFGMTGTSVSNDSADIATLWEFTNTIGNTYNIFTQYSGNGTSLTSYYLRLSNNTILSTTTNTVIYNNNKISYSSGGWFSSTYYLRYDNSNSWSRSTTNNNNTLTRDAITFTAATVNMVSSTYKTYEISNTVNTNATQEATREYYTKTVTTEAAGQDSYFPLVASDTDPFKVDDKNTGYIVGGSYASYQENLGDTRVGWYAMSSLYKALGYSSDRNVTYSDNSLQVITRAYNSDGFKTLTNSTTKKTIADYGLVKYNDAKDGLQTAIKKDNDTSRVYGMHFMDMNGATFMTNQNTVDQRYLVTAKSAVINGETFENYQMPEDCIDFQLASKGYINFFAGTYYVIDNTYKNNSFFSLYMIERNNDKYQTIKGINRIKEVYGKFVDGKLDLTAEYKYVYVGNTNSPSFVYDNDEGYQKIFDCDWIEGTGYTIETYSMYYFEIPVNKGEYALGSVPIEGRYGAYLMYLDIGASASGHNSVLGTIDFVYDNNSNTIITVKDYDDSDSTVATYLPSQIIIYTKNTDRTGEADDADYVLISNFVINIRRYITNTSDTQAKAVITFTGGDNTHITAVTQTKSGDSLTVSHDPPGTG